MRYAALAFIVTSPLALALSAPAIAAEKKQDGGLPGVNKDFRLVKPAGAVPEPEKVAKDEEGFVQIGENTRMKISGLIRYDIEFDSRDRKSPQPRR